MIVYVGPVIGAHDKNIGADKADVPMGFWKVVVDPQTGDAIAFVMPQKAVSKAKALGAAKLFCSD